MRPGTSGFVGARLKQAREERSLTLTALAEIIGVSKQSISKYENDHQTPGPEVLDRIAERLNFSKLFFLKQPHQLGPSPLFFRCPPSAATKAACGRAAVRFTWLKEVVDYLREFVEFPPPQIPVVNVQDPFSELTDDVIEHVATECRRQWDLRGGPISNMIALVESKGVIVSQGALDNPKLDAFSQWSVTDETPYIFLSTEKRSCVRSRFDVAHELGHLVFHRNVSKIGNSSRHKVLERQAHRFAGAFLMPSETFRQDFPTPSIDVFRMLKEKWKTSIGSMIIRCWHMGLIDEEQYRKLTISHSRRGWRKREPLDDSLPIEKPRLLRKCIELLVNKNVQSKEEIKFRLPFAPIDIEELCSLPIGYFDDKKTKIESIEPRLRSFAKKSAKQKRGKVISFDR